MFSGRSRAQGDENGTIIEKSMFFEGSVLGPFNIEIPQAELFLACMSLPHRKPHRNYGNAV